MTSCQFGRWKQVLTRLKAFNVSLQVHWICRIWAACDVDGGQNPVKWDKIFHMNASSHLTVIDIFNTIISLCYFPGQLKSAVTISIGDWKIMHRYPIYCANSFVKFRIVNYKLPTKIFARCICAPLTLVKSCIFKSFRFWRLKTRRNSCKIWLNCCVIRVVCLNQVW
jgi:hypothetical protein